MESSTVNPLLIVVMTCGVLLGADAKHADVPESPDPSKARTTIRRGISFLRTTQNADGSWTPGPGPAVTALVVRAMLDQPDITVQDRYVAAGVAYILSKRQPDGGFHDGFLQNYNTAICLSALATLTDQSGVAGAVDGAQKYLKELQWCGKQDSQGRMVDAAHPHFGGAGYGKHGRPDLSNTQVMLQGLHDSGLSTDAPVYRRAVQFIARCQGNAQNEMFADQIESDGGFIYATSVDKDTVGMPQSMANPEMIDEARSGRPVSGLRTYGSMTYAGFKSYIYAGLRRDDPRVLDAYHWIRHHYTLEHNPGLPEAMNMQGYYYYLMTFARALSAWGSDRITTGDGRVHDWPSELSDKLARVQRADGSWRNDADRWLEEDPNLVTAYALIALNSAVEAEQTTE